MFLALFNIQATSGGSHLTNVEIETTQSGVYLLQQVANLTSLDDVSKRRFYEGTCETSDAAEC